MLPTVETRWDALSDDNVMTSIICEAEVLFGLEKKNSERLWKEYGERLENRVPILPVDGSVARAYAKLRVHTRKTGRTRDDLDLLIAATAVAHNLKLATLNVRHFEGLPGLAVEDWSEE